MNIAHWRLAAVLLALLLFSILMACRFYRPQPAPRPVASEIITRALAEGTRYLEAHRK